MKISFTNGVVVNVSHLNEQFLPKTHKQIITEAAERCLNVLTPGTLLDDTFRPLARFDGEGKQLAL